jgi:hypothetical protein
MTVRTSAGSTFKLSAGVPATFNGAGYAALTYTAVGEITDFGEFGREYNLTTHNPVGNRSTQKFKGSFNEGSLTLQLGLDNADAGQTLCQAAVLSDNNYAVEITIQDGTKYYFQCQVMSFKIGMGDVNKITSATIMIEITTSSTGVGIVKV